MTSEPKLDGCTGDQWTPERVGELKQRMTLGMVRGWIAQHGHITLCTLSAVEAFELAAIWTAALELLPQAEADGATELRSFLACTSETMAESCERLAIDEAPITRLVASHFHETYRIDAIATTTKLARARTPRGGAPAAIPDPRGTAAQLPLPADQAWLADTDLAGYLGVDRNALRQRLNRWRKKNDEGWREVTDRKPREPKYLYRVGAVRTLVVDLKGVRRSDQRTNSEKEAR